MTDQQPPQPQQPPPTQQPQRRASTGNVIAGVFLVLLAIALILTGGGCTIAMFAFGGLSDPSMIPLLLISLAVLGGGGVAMWFGVRLITGRYE